ncbi:DUF5689 domain-containing protein [Aestuariibaculum marinum]|uniref:Choice-of-anchor J domain-containing protein n=1 Tax=Aestuariibaculum marinum TaxID=2683592 RepID=A0A8J6U583_9FLAO|nr:DUF5689 domain-containing protein [Aestuariibaculum marinum]MBD0823544.1 choice-of-anchor J domain-containing protein [Aestuariibaculum marinum]
MKTTNIYLTLALSFALALTSCVHDDDYSIPNVEIEEPNIEANTTISIVKDMYAGSLVDFNEANNEGELIIEGYVVSNDEAGNFYKVLIIQDKPEDPTAAIQLDVDVTSLYALYKPGQKVYVKLNGLGMDELNSVLHIGEIDGTSVGRISAFTYDDYIIRSAEVATIVPKVITPSEFNDNYINMLVQIDNMQLNSSEVGEPYANADNTFTVNRYLKNCEDNSQTILRNSGFADFKNELFPIGQGSIVAVFSKYNSDYQLFIRDTNDVMFDDERCTPGAYEPTDPVSLPYTQDFEGNYVDGQDLSIEGWYTTSASGGAEVFTLEKYNNNFFAQAQAFGSEESSMEAWLVSPGLVIDALTSNPVLSFGTIDGYNNGNPLTVYVSTDFSGDVTAANWTQLNPVISSTNPNGYGSTFIDSGELDLSAYVGETIFVGFKYKGGTSSITTTIQIDDFYAGPSTNTGGNNGGGSSSAEGLAFLGGDFENYNAFISGLNSFGIKDYATQSTGNGVDGSTALSLITAGTTGNDYVFTALANSDLPSTYSKIKFALKGTSDKTISINLYKADGTYYRFNLGDITTSATILASASNQYAGVINTAGEWIEITLDLSGITDLNISDTTKDFLALKIGKEVAYNLYLDNFTIE